VNSEDVRGIGGGSVFGVWKMINYPVERCEGQINNAEERI